MTETALRLATIGECMVEMRQSAPGRFEQGFGGDTLNTAAYLARLGVAADFATAVGDDPWSEAMGAFWVAEGVGLPLVRRVPGATPGLYVIEVDAAGERRFSYWREHSPARRLFDDPDPAWTAALEGYDALYFSGITLSLYDPDARRRLFETLGRARGNGARIVFDTNFRPRGWPDRDAARAAYGSALAAADLVFASTEDLELLFGTAGTAALEAHRDGREIVLRHPDLTVLIEAGGRTVAVPGRPAPRIVDTTAAGDSFAAAYLAARFRGADPREAAEAGHRLAAIVVGYPGAIIPKEAMPPIQTERTERSSPR